jgi:hypothetical protein
MIEDKIEDGQYVAPEPTEPKIETEWEVETPPPIFKCAKKDHVQYDAFLHESRNPETGEVEVSSGPVCRACLCIWLGAKFRTIQIEAPKPEPVNS